MLGSIRRSIALGGLRAPGGLLTLGGLIAITGMFAVGSALAHTSTIDPPLHVNSSNKTCDFEFSSNLTQDAFEQFTQEIGDIVIYKNSGARAMPAGDFSLAIGFSQSPVEQHSAAWNDTFTHPDADHELGDAIALPILYGNVGLGKRMDLGGYFSGNPDASYRLLGLGLKREIGNASELGSRTAVSLDYGLLFGPHDTTINTVGIDLHAGWDWKAISLYGSGGAQWTHATENSPLVDLYDEDTFSPHVSVGVTPHLGGIADFDFRARFASVNTYEFRMGHTF